MCPHGYHHNGFMATPALGTQEVRLITYIHLFQIVYTIQTYIRRYPRLFVIMYTLIYLTYILCLLHLRNLKTKFWQNNICL